LCVCIYIYTTLALCIISFSSTLKRYTHPGVTGINWHKENRHEADHWEEEGQYVAETSISLYLYACVWGTDDDTPHGESCHRADRLTWVWPTLFLAWVERRWGFPGRHLKYSTSRNLRSTSSCWRCPSQRPCLSPQNGE
jgi:hypothetical protein